MSSHDFSIEGGQLPDETTDQVCLASTLSWMKNMDGWLLFGSDATASSPALPGSKEAGKENKVKGNSPLQVSLLCCH